MKISRKRWHYKLRTYPEGWEKHDDNLCRYSWACVSKAMVLVACIIAFGAFGYTFFTSPYWVSVSIVVLFLILSIALPVMAVTFIRRKLGRSPKLPRENLMVEYIKAKKDRICPIIEYVD